MNLVLSSLPFYIWGAQITTLVCGEADLLSPFLRSPATRAEIGSEFSFSISILLCLRYYWCCDKSLDRSSLWKEGFLQVHSLVVFIVVGRSWRQELEAIGHDAPSQETESSDCSTLLPCLFNPVQDPSLGNGATHFHRN